MTRLVTAALVAAVCAALTGCGEDKPTGAPSAPSAPSASELFDNKKPPPPGKGTAGPG